MNLRGLLIAALALSGCIGRPAPAQCAVDEDCGAATACFAGECLAGTRTDGGLGWCPLLQPRFSDIDRSFLKVSCGSKTTQCHTAGDARGADQASGLDLSGDAYAVLVSTPAALVHARMAPGILLVKPGEPDNSFLMIKLRQKGFEANTGAGMPPDHPGETCDAALSAIQAWIADGAQRN